MKSVLYDDQDVIVCRSSGFNALTQFSGDENAASTDQYLLTGSESQKLLQEAFFLVRN